MYENRKKVYDGMWMKGHRFDGLVLTVLIAMIVMTVISFLLLFYIGIVVLVIDIIFWIGVWLYFPSIQLVFGCKKGKKSKTVQMKNDLKYAKQLDFLTLSLPHHLSEYHCCSHSILSYHSFSNFAETMSWIECCRFDGD